MTEQIFKENIAFLTKYLRFELSTEYVVLYWNMLKHLDDNKFKQAMNNIIKDFVPTNAVPFPLVVHFLRYCGEAGDNQIINGIAKLKKMIRVVGQYESIDFKDSALHYTINVFGGWPSICTWTDKDWDINEGRLSQTYKTAIETERTDEGRLPGISEQAGGVFRIHIISQTGKILSRLLPQKNEMVAQNSQKNINRYEFESIGDILSKNLH